MNKRKRNDGQMTVTKVRRTKNAPLARLVGGVRGVYAGCGGSSTVSLETDPKSVTTRASEEPCRGGLGIRQQGNKAKRRSSEYQADCQAETLQTRR